MVRLLSMLIMALFIAACTGTPGPSGRPVAITSLDQAEFVNVQTGERLRLGRRGRYENSQLRQTSDKRYASARDIRTGSWDLLSARWQVVILDGLDSIRISCQPDAKVPYTFTRVAMIPYGALTSTERQNYEKIQGQWYVLRSKLEPAADERSLSALLEPAGRVLP